MCVTSGVGNNCTEYGNDNGLDAHEKFTQHRVEFLKLSTKHYQSVK